MTEFNLGERIINQEPERWKGGYPIFHEAILKDDVKEFIRLLEEEGLKEKPCFVDISCGEYEFDTETFIKFINKLAGEKLIS